MPNPHNPQDLNRYTYVRNNPLIYTDPTGHCPDYTEYLGGCHDGLWDPDPEPMPVAVHELDPPSYAQVQLVSDHAGMHSGAGGSHGSGSGYDNAHSNLVAGQIEQLPNGDLLAPGVIITPVSEMITTPEITIQAELAQMTADGSLLLNLFLTLPINSNGGLGAGPTLNSAGMGALANAAKCGILGYRQLRNAIKGTGLQAHHLIERRFDKMPELKEFKSLSVAVSKEEHQFFTNAWRSEISYGKETRGADVDSVIEAARKIYSNYPAIMRRLGID